MVSYWQQHKHRLRAWIAGQVHDSAAVDDILQEVWLKAHQQLHRLRSDQSLGAWLFRIARNAIVDHYRAQKSEPLSGVSSDELADTLQAPEADPAEAAHQALASCLLPLIDELPEKYRLSLQLAELENHTQQQVADRLGLSLSGAKSRIQRGRALLRQRLTSCCDIEVGRGGVVDFQPRADQQAECKTC